MKTPMKDYRFRPATSDDVPRILQIIAQAQRRMAAAGSAQWQNGYPAPENIVSDLDRGYGHVLCRDGRPDGCERRNCKTENGARGLSAACIPRTDAAGDAQRNIAAESGATTTSTTSSTSSSATAHGDSGTVVAYGAIVFDGEPAYDALDGRWLTEGPYVVVHRLAVSDDAVGQGFGTAFLQQAERLARGRGLDSFRIDTNFDNRRMLRILAREGFAYCGKIRYESGERLAFEKRLGGTSGGK